MCILLTFDKKLVTILNKMKEIMTLSEKSKQIIPNVNNIKELDEGVKLLQLD